MHLQELLDISTVSPDRPFLISTAGAHTYGSLSKQVDAYLAHLTSMDSAGRHCVLQSADPFLFAAVYLACVRTGWIFVPLPPSMPASQRDTILRECPGILMQDGTVVAASRAVPPVPSSDADRTAVIMYTSGSTGAPKGVQLSARALAANTRSVLAYLPVRQDDRHLVTMPFHYVYGLSMLNVHLARRASLFMSDSFRNPQDLVEQIRSFRCTALSGVPTVYIALCKRSHFLSTDLGPQFRYMTQAGGRLSPDLVDTIRSRHRRADFFVMYGCTEAAARITAMDPARYDEKRGSVGRPIEGMEIEIRGPGHARLRSGMEGEIWVRGDHLMNGYHLDPELTAQYLQGGWLNTGDLGYLDGEGFLYLTGRSKDLIKVAGHRVAAREVEDVLLSHPDVEQVCVVGREVTGGDEEVAAALVARTRDVGALRKHCLARLPNFKCPTRFVFVEDLPKNSSGKISRVDVLKSLA